METPEAPVVGVRDAGGLKALCDAGVDVEVAEADALDGTVLEETEGRLRSGEAARGGDNGIDAQDSWGGRDDGEETGVLGTSPGGIRGPGFEAAAKASAGDEDAVSGASMPLRQAGRSR